MGNYPLSRFLYLYVNKPPGEALPAEIESCIRYVLSDQGQDIAEATGFVPLTAERIARQSEKLAAGFEPRWWGYLD